MKTENKSIRHKLGMRKWDLRPMEIVFISILFIPFGLLIMAYILKCLNCYPLLKTVLCCISLAWGFVTAVFAMVAWYENPTGYSGDTNWY